MDYKELIIRFIPNKKYKIYVFNVVPNTKPRMTQRDKWKKRPVVVKYHAYKDALKAEAKKNGYTLKERLKVLFFIPTPKSWSNKKKASMHLKPHQQTPDTDNLVKAFKDTLAPEDIGDSFVWDEHAQKYWSNKGMIVVLEDV